MLVSGCHVADDVCWTERWSLFIKHPYEETAVAESDLQANTEYLSSFVYPKDPWKKNCL